MESLLRFSRLVDGLTDRLGRGLPWLVLIMTLLGAGNAVARYVGRAVGHSLTSNGLIELQWYLFSALFLLGASVAVRQGAHVRVDVLQSRLSRRVRDWIDFLGTLLFLLPFACFGFVASWPTVARSFATREVSPDPGGLYRFPVKIFLLLGFGMLFLQGLSELIKKGSELRTASRVGSEDFESPGGPG